MKNKLLAILAVGLLAGPMAANAVVITWNLNNFVFTDGGTATGFFDWDTDTQAATNWEFMLSGGDTDEFPAATLTDESGLSNFFFSDDAANLIFCSTPDCFSPRRELRLSIAAFDLLDTPVANLTLTGSAYTGSTGYVDCYNCAGRFGIEGGFLSASVPEPGTLALLGLGLLGLGFARRRKPN